MIQCRRLSKLYVINRVSTWVGDLGGQKEMIYMNTIQEYLTGQISYTEMWRELADSGELDLLDLVTE